MGSLSMFHWLILLVMWVLWIVPLYRILGRIGWSQGWAFVALIPPLGMVLLWFIAFGKWKPTAGTIG